MEIYNVPKKRLMLALLLPTGVCNMELMRPVYLLIIMARIMHNISSVKCKPYTRESVN